MERELRLRRQTWDDQLMDDDFFLQGEWVVIGSLPDTVLFQADDDEGLLAQIIDSFGPNERQHQAQAAGQGRALKALNRGIRTQVQLSALYKEKGGYAGGPQRAAGR